MISLYLKSIGILAPGIKSWEDAVQVFKHPEQFEPKPIDKKLETILPANERRRAARTTQLALYAAQQTGDNDFSQCLQIFSSSNGDVTTFHQISLALGMDGRPVSPTRFHNSVHNAAAGYWSIATESQTPSTSLTAYSDSFPAGLLEAGVQLNASDNTQSRDCLLVSYDEQPPAPFQPLIRITSEFACAMRFGCTAESALVRLDIEFTNDQSKQPSKMKDPQMEQLRQSNFNACALPLLEVIAQPQGETIYLPYFEQLMAVTVTPIM